MITINEWIHIHTEQTMDIKNMELSGDSITYETIRNRLQNLGVIGCCIHLNLHDLLDQNMYSFIDFIFQAWTGFNCWRVLSIYNCVSTTTTVFTLFCVLSLSQCQSARQDLAGMKKRGWAVSWGMHRPSSPRMCWATATIIQRHSAHLWMSSNSICRPPCSWDCSFCCWCCIDHATRTSWIGIGWSLCMSSVRSESLFRSFSPRSQEASVGWLGSVSWYVHLPWFVANGSYNHLFPFRRITWRKCSFWTMYGSVSWTRKRRNSRATINLPLCTSSSMSGWSCSSFACCRWSRCFTFWWTKVCSLYFDWPCTYNPFLGAFCDWTLVGTFYYLGKWMDRKGPDDSGYLGYGTLGMAAACTHILSIQPLFFGIAYAWITLAAPTIFLLMPTFILYIWFSAADKDKKPIVIQVRLHSLCSFRCPNFCDSAQSDRRGSNGGETERVIVANGEEDGRGYGVKATR